MPTPAQNVNIAVNGSGHYHEINPANGWVFADFDYVHTLARVTKYRGVSVNNPKRSDNTRKPSSWAARGVLREGRVWIRPDDMARISHPDLDRCNRPAPA